MGFLEINISILKFAWVLNTNQIWELFQCYTETKVDQRWVYCKEVRVQDSKPGPCYLMWHVSCGAILSAGEDSEGGNFGAFLYVRDYDLLLTILEEKKNLLDSIILIICSSCNSFVSNTLGFNLLGVSHLFDGCKTHRKNVVMDNNPWGQREISYLVNEVKLQYLLHDHELNHWDLVGRNDWDNFTEMQKCRETAFKEKSQNIELVQRKSKNEL